MAISVKSVPRETPPLRKKGPMLRMDIDTLMKQIEAMSYEEREKLMNMLAEYVVLLERENGRKIRPPL